jgi:hypothetical protein
LISVVGTDLRKTELRKLLSNRGLHTVRSIVLSTSAHTHACAVVILIGLPRTVLQMARCLPCSWLPC